MQPFLTAAQRVIALINSQPRTPSVDDIATVIRDGLLDGSTISFRRDVVRAGAENGWQAWEPGNTVVIGGINVDSMYTGRDVADLVKGILAFKSGGGDVELADD